MLCNELYKINAGGSPCYIMSQGIFSYDGSSTYRTMSVHRYNAMNIMHEMQCDKLKVSNILNVMRKVANAKY